MTERFLVVNTPRDTEGEFVQLMSAISHQNEGRTNWKEHDDPVVVAKFIREEAGELVEEIEQEKPAIAVASEIGDVLYLTLRLCAQLGIDPRDALEMKIVRNSIKYPDSVNSSGDYQEGINHSKALYAQMGGDLAFYDAYNTLVGDATNAPEGYSVPTETLVGHNGNDPKQMTLFEFKDS
jgi:NTP pyrophosphatase (non-canonical NTP hydrolase)